MIRKVSVRAAPPAVPASAWTKAERAVFAKLTTPARIQDFLDKLAYRAELAAACPRRVLLERRAHCYDGALFAAAALRRLGHAPMLMDLWAVRDDDHVLALFRDRGLWGAVGKSNFVGLRFREPIHRNLRELALSYFEDYYNDAGEKTLRAFGGPLRLAQFDRLGWMFHDAPVAYVSDRLDALRHRPLVRPAQEKRLSRMDARSYEAGMVGTDRSALYKAG